MNGPPPAPAPGWVPGGIVDGYRLERRLAGGGMGEVWGAVQLATGSLRVIKTLLPDASPVEHERLAREGQALAALEGHPNLLRVHSSGHAHGRGYLVLDYAAGGDLLSRLEKGPLAPEQARGLLATLADAVSFVHARGLFHRDLKPQNVLFAEDGRPLLADFGLVRGARRSSLTQSTDVLGTPAYMAPEQAVGGEVDARTDVYGLGAVLYHALTGRPPFHARSMIESMRQVVEDAPAPPSEISRAVPRDLERICLKALAKDPAQRFQDSDELRDVLLGRRPLDPRPRRRWPLAVAAALAVGGACAAAFLWGTAPVDVAPRGAELPPRRSRPTAADPPSAETAEDHLRTLLAGLPPLDEVLANTPPEQRVSAYVQGAIAYRIRGSTLYGAANDRLLAPPEEIACLFAAAAEAGDFRAWGYFAKLLARPSAAPLWPDTAERDAMARLLGRRSAAAGCSVAALWVGESMANHTTGFTPDASEVQGYYALSLERDLPESGALDAERRLRIVILKLAFLYPRTAPPRAALLEHLRALYELAHWELTSARDQALLLHYTAELQREQGEAELAALAAQPLERELLEHPQHRDLVHDLDLDDPGADPSLILGVSSQLLSHVRSGSCTLDPAGTRRAAVQLLLLATQDDIPGAGYDLYLALGSAKGAWTRDLSRAAREACLLRAHATGDERATAELAYSALNWRESSWLGVPCDPVRARHYLDALGAPPANGPFRTFARLATTSAWLHLAYPYTVGSPWDRSTTTAVFDSALRMPVEDGHAELEELRALFRGNTPR